MEASRTTDRKKPPRRRYSRLTILIVLGFIAIAAGLGVRYSPWAWERYLRALSLEELALAVHDTPNDPLTFVYYGSALLQANRLDASEWAFRRATKLSPKMARAWLGLGSVRLRRRDLKGAVEAFQEATRLAPREPSGHMGLAQAYYLAGSPRRAVEPLEKLVQLQPKQAIAWYTLGKVSGDSLRWDKAYEALRRAVALDPTKADYWRDLGQVARNYGRLQEAEQYQIKAIQLSPKEASSYYYLGEIYMRLGDTPRYRGQAEQSFLAAIARDPTLSAAYFQLGQLYERRGIYDIAEVNYRKACEIDPGDDRALYHRGMCLVRLGKRVEGQKLISASQELSYARKAIANLQNRCIAEPNNRALRLRLARLYRRYGNHEGALEHYQLYQRMGPSDAAVDREAENYRTELTRQGILPANKPQNLSPQRPPEP